MPEGPWWVLGLVLGIVGPLLVRRYLDRTRQQARQTTRQILAQTQQKGTKP